MRHLAEPAWLALIALAPLPWFWQRTRPRVSWPTLGGFEGVRTRRTDWIRLVPPALRSVAIAAMAVALARPQSVGGETRVAGRGVAIVAAIDRSSSMNEAEHPGGPTKLDSAKGTLARFIEGRPDDLIGLVPFARFPDLECPPTLDHAFLIDAAESIRPARAGEDGTNLGDAVVWALDALAPEKLGPEAPARRVLIVVTDGRNQPGVPAPTDPVVACKLARDLGVTVHTVAIGPDATPGDPDGPDVDLLRTMAEAGGGRPFRAGGASGLGEVFHAIDGLEKSAIRGTVRVRYNEENAPWLVTALAAIGLERLASSGRGRRLP